MDRSTATRPETEGPRPELPPGLLDPGTVTVAHGLAVQALELLGRLHLDLEAVYERAEREGWSDADVHAALEGCPGYAADRILSLTAGAICEAGGGVPEGPFDLAVIAAVAAEHAR